MLTALCQIYFHTQMQNLGLKCSKGIKKSYAKINIYFWDLISLLTLG